MSLSDAEVIAAIQANHLKANISAYEEGMHDAVVHWDRAYLDSMGPGSLYAHVPITLTDISDEIVVRVYPPERLRKRLAQRWTGMARHQESVRQALAEMRVGVSPREEPEPKGATDDQG
jgi:hypothetical protein